MLIYKQKLAYFTLLLHFGTKIYLVNFEIHEKLSKQKYTKSIVCEYITYDSI